jgi:hypothetical protein
MSIRARKRVDPRVNINKAYQVILNPLVKLYLQCQLQQQKLILNHL